MLVALGVAAVAARSYRPFASDEASATGRAPSTAFVDSTFTLVLCLIGGLALVALVSLPSLRGTKKPRGRASLQGLITYLVFIVLAVAIGQHVARRPFHVGQEEGKGDAVFPPTQPGVHQQPSSVGHTRSPEIVWPIVIGAGVLAAVVVIALYVMSRRRKQATGSTTGALEAAAAELEDAIDDLRREPDPRKAVVASYARMESALTLVGLPRRAAEAPLEYLGRAGRALQTESSMASLTESFEEAKFSEHTIGESMRERAIAALTAVRDEVRSSA